MLVNTHCHLDAKYFPEAAADEAITRARAAGVGFFVAIGVSEDLASARSAIALAHRRDDVRAVAGLHPHDADHFNEAIVDELGVMLDDDRVVALGEIGLDYHYLRSPRDAQTTAFRRLIALAREKKKPIVIHTRDAAEDTIAILREENARDVGGIIHCFSEDKAFAEKALDLDFDLSFSGNVTFKSAKAIQEVAAWAPADRVLVETDSPYLAPVPLRGKKCEPGYVLHTAKFVAALRGDDLDVFATTTTANAKRRLALPI
jgi:TatD DNase family protein